MSKATNRLTNEIAESIATYLAENNILDVKEIKTIVSIKIKDGIEAALKESYNDTNALLEHARGKNRQELKQRLSMHNTLITDINEERKYVKLKLFLRERNPQLLEDFFSTL